MTRSATGHAGREEIRRVQSRPIYELPLVQPDGDIRGSPVTMRFELLCYMLVLNGE